MPASTSPVPDLYLYQIGSESTWGTAVAQTAKLGLVEDLQIAPEVTGENLPDRRSSLAPAYVAGLFKSTGTAKMSGICTYEDLPYWLDSLFGTATPTGANPYVRAYTGVLGTVPTRKSFTLAKGQSSPYSHTYGLTGAIVKEMTVKFEAGKPWMYDISFIGKNVSTDTIDSLSDRTQTPINGVETLLYIDAVGGTIGTTAVSTTWFAGELNIKSNAETHFGLGSLTPASFHEARWEASLKMTLEIDATSKAMFDSIIGTSLLQKQIRVKATTGASAIQQFDLGGSFLKAPELTTDTDGVSTLEFEFTSVYNSTLGNHIKASNTNTVATLV